MGTWGEWFKEQTDVLKDGFNEFSSQLADDTDEVATEVTTAAANVNEQLTAEKVGETLSYAASYAISRSEDIADTANTVAANTAELLESAQLGGALEQLREGVSAASDQATSVGGQLFTGLADGVVSADEAAAGLLSQSKHGLQRIGQLAFAAGLMHPTHAAAAGLVDPADAAPSTPGAAPADDAAARRVAAKMRALGADVAALRAPAADGAGFARWSEEFEVLERTARIEALLAEQARCGAPRQPSRAEPRPPLAWQEALRESYAALVPSAMSYRAFWARYFFEERQLLLHEARAPPAPPPWQARPPCPPSPRAAGAERRAAAKGRADRRGGAARALQLGRLARRRRAAAAQPAGSRAAGARAAAARAAAKGPAAKRAAAKRAAAKGAAASRPALFRPRGAPG